MPWESFPFRYATFWTVDHHFPILPLSSFDTFFALAHQIGLHLVFCFLLFAVCSTHWVGMFTPLAIFGLASCSDLAR